MKELSGGGVWLDDRTVADIVLCPVSRADLIRETRRGAEIDVGRITPEVVLYEARTWLGTPWHHHQCVKHVGVDCVHYPFGVCRELGILPAGFVMPDYVSTPDGTTLIATCDKYLQRVTRATMRAADLIVLATDADPQHVGFLYDYRPGVFGIIHASNDRSCVPPRVIEHRLMFHKALRFVAAYRIPGVA